MVEADRLNNIQEYYFSSKLIQIAALRAKGVDVINLGIGSPDLPPDIAVLDELEKQAKAGSHQYQSYWGLPELREAMQSFYKNKFGVGLEIDQIAPLMGSKEGIMHISMAFLNAGDSVLIPNPGYPTYRSVSHLVQANILEYNLSEANHWMPDFDELDELAKQKPKMMWVNYPHMPTGAKAEKGFFRKLINWAKTNNIILINDNPYSFVLNEKPESILAYCEKEDNVLELNSLSKTFNIAGWRIGMLLGNQNLIRSVIKVKSNMDSGMFYGLQKAAIVALALGEEWYANLNQAYANRREIVWKICDALSLEYEKDTAGMFVLAKIPNLSDDKVFSDEMLAKHQVFLTPASIFGCATKGYIRISLCADEASLEKALKRITV